MVKSVDPAQTDLGLHSLHNYAILSGTLVIKILGHLQYSSNWIELCQYLGG